MLLALLMDRCLFVDFPFFEEYFEHELDFTWSRHARKLLGLGHNVTDPANSPVRLFNYLYNLQSVPDMWMNTNFRETFDHHYGIEIFKDHDWSAALLQSNPFHKVLHPLQDVSRELR